MFRNAHDKLHGGFPEPSTIHLMQALFGWEASNHAIVANVFSEPRQFRADDGFTVICGDAMVLLDTFPHSPDPRGTWVDLQHQWRVDYDDYNPCDSNRKPGSLYDLNSFTIDSRLIY